MSTLKREEIEKLRTSIKCAMNNLWTSTEIRTKTNRELDALCDLALSALQPESPWQHFDAAYKKACESSQPQDWMNAALAAQQVRNTELVEIPGLVQVGKLVEIPDGFGEHPNTVYCEWNERRFNLPAGTKIYVRAQDKQISDL